MAVSASKDRASLQIHEDERFERRHWRIQRIAWVVMSLLIVAALTGVFGSGPLSRASVGDADALQVEYPRFARHHASEQLRIRMGERAMQGSGELELAVSRDYLSAFEVESITPEPQRVTGRAGELVFAFPIEPGTRSLEVTFELQPGPVGPHSGTLRAGNSLSVQVSSFIYP